MQSKPPPNVFVGSAATAIQIAEAVEQNLDREASVYRWDLHFEPGKANLENLARAVDTMDFAVLILTPDDITESKGSKLDSPRDNIVFELGLFLGRLGRERTFGMVRRQEKLKLPTDLAGITLLDYPEAHTSGKLRMQIASACTEVLTAIRNLGRFSERLDSTPEPTYPRFNLDMAALDNRWDPRVVVGLQTVVIVMIAGIIAELLDRPGVHALHNAIDAFGKGVKFCRGVIVTYDDWQSLKWLHDRPTIAVGGPWVNPLTKDILAKVEAGEGSQWLQSQGNAAYQSRTSTTSPRVALWGDNSASTRSAVDSWIAKNEGLRQFLLVDARWEGSL